MAQFYICHNKHQENLVTQLQFDEQNLDLLTSAQYVRKAALKVSDIRTKLVLSKISQYLERMYQQMQGSLVERRVQSRGKQNLPTGCFAVQNKENMQMLNEPKCFAKLQTSRSKIDEVIKSSRVQYKRKDPSKTELLDSLGWRQVVTNNFIDGPEKQVRVRFSLEQDEDIGSSTLLQRKITEKLQEDNSIFQKCLRNIFQFFSSKDLVQFDGTIEPHRCGALYLELAANFQSYQQQNNFQLSNLFAKSVLLEQTVDKLSADLAQYSYQLQTSSQLQPLQTDCQHRQSVQLKETSKELAQARQNIQKYEMIIYIKDEEIRSIKAIVSDYENRFNKIAEIDSRSLSKSRSKSYKKFFEESGDNFSSTAS